MRHHMRCLPVKPAMRVTRVDQVTVCHRRQQPLVRSGCSLCLKLTQSNVQAQHLP